MSTSALCPLIAVALALPFSLAAIAEDRPRSISRIDLPAPNQAISELLRRANVSFTAGGADPPADDSSNRRADARTTYDASYKYRTKTQWLVRVAGQRRRLIVRVRFAAIRFDPTHVVWFREQPNLERFWQNKLVLHELDHVRISSDPRMAKRFRQKLMENDLIETELAAGTVVDDAFIRDLIAEHVRAIFDEVDELIEIRYRELDRLTRHGVDPLPEDSSLHQMLRAD